MIVAAAKRGSSAPGTVIRVQEVSGQPTRAVLAIRGRLERWESQMSPHELRSVFVPDDTTAPVRVIDLCELEIDERDSP